MKKQLQRKYGGFIALLSASVLMFLGLGACMNPLQPPVERGPGNADGSTGVRISIVNGEARTLLPSTPFSKYVLSFSNSQGVTAPDVTLTADTGIVPLAPGDWTITVTAYVVNTEGYDFPAAEGSAPVSLISGEETPVSIRVSARLGGGNGSFSYAVSYPEVVTYGYLQLFDIDGNPRWFETITPTSESTGTNEYLPAGYYILRIQLGTGYVMAVRTEIVHIYPGMETLWECDFTEDDFGDPITISGTVDLSGLEDISFAYISLSRYPDFSLEEGAVSGYDLSDTWDWNFRTLPFKQPTDLYVELVVQFTNGATLIKRLPAPVSVHGGDVSGVDMGPYEVHQFNLSGQVDFSFLTSMGAPISYANVTAYQDAGPLSLEIGYTAVDPNVGSWSLDILPETTSLPVLIILRVGISGATLYDELKTTINNSGQSGLNFAPGPVIAGTTNNGVGTVNGNYSYLFVPDTIGEYVFNVSGAGSEYIELALYSALGEPLGSASGVPDAALSYGLTTGIPYFIQLHLNNSPYGTFQFRVEEPQPVTLSGTVDLSGLVPPLLDADIWYTEIQVYNDAANPVQLGSSVIAESDGSWSMVIPISASGTQVVKIVARTRLYNDRWIITHRQDTISGNTPGLDLAAAVVFYNSGPLTRVSGYSVDSFLLVPSANGFFNLEAASGGMSGPGSGLNLALFDVATGVALAEGTNSLYASLTAGEPYIVQVWNIGSFTAYQFQMSAITSTETIGGSIDYSGLPASVVIDSPMVSGYLEPSHTQVVFGVPVTGNAWSVLVPSDAVGQTIRLVLTMNINGLTINGNALAINSHIQTVLSASASDLDFAPTAVPSGTMVNGKTPANGSDYFLFVPSTGGGFALTAENNTYLGITAIDALTGVLIGTSWEASPAVINSSLIGGNPYIIEINSNSFMDYQFTAIAD
jgi:hypothetical protein